MTDRVPRWVPAVSLTLALAGLGASTYLTITHYTTPKALVCATSGTVNCERVTTSPQSMFLGIPVAVLGLAWFAAMAVLSLPAAWRTGSRLVHLARTIGATGGIGFALWLVYAELVLIGAICVWCTVAHVMALGLFVVTVITAPDLLARP
jgi:uncharacterized membrane protein